MEIDLNKTIAINLCFMCHGIFSSFVSVWRGDNFIIIFPNRNNSFFVLFADAGSLV